MSERRDCDELRRVAPEIALGIATGDERAAALEHLAVCADCRRHLDGLAQVADELVTLAPAREPPLGFESAVVGRLGERRARRLRVPLAAAAAALVVALAGVGATLAATSDERDLAARYRDTLATARGDYFAAAGLLAPDGERAGTVFAYEGEPSWIFMTLDRARAGPFECVVVTEDGGRLSLGSFDASRGVWGATLPVPVHDVERVVLDGPSGALEGALGH
ncbi:MAG TPA: hypothetical protein VHJ34_06545 [Actinomycetota bacterium]|nr:hypothetical protein [Actinomycetota bacterium]